MEKKITRKDVLNTIVAITDTELEFEVAEGVIVTGADIVEFAEKTLAQLEKKADSAKAKKAEASDALREAVVAALSNEPATIAKITEAIDVEGVTPAKVVARLTALVKAGVAEKSEVKLEDGRKIKAYALVG